MLSVGESVPNYTASL